MIKVSVIIPIYNEESVIRDCLNSLENQSIKDFEVILVDDGSIDKTLKILSNLQNLDYKFQVLKQKHKGPGEARNLGAKNAKGEILVFVDADMSFHPKFIEKLTKPIFEGKVNGTFSKEEFLENKDNIWSKCWNINRGLPIDRMHAENYPDEQPVFRAILKSEFEKVGGFDSTGYIDDYTLSEKLGYNANNAEGAILYHKNPDNLKDVYKQARWVGKSEFKRRKIKNENLMRIIAIIRYSFPMSLINGLRVVLRSKIPEYLIFKTIYDFAIEISLLKSFFGEQKYK